MPAGYVGKTPVMPSGLTAAQEHAHRAMLKYQATHHRPVATRELARLLGHASPQGAMCHLKALRLAGAVIKLGEGARRYLAVPFGGPARAKRGRLVEGRGSKN